MKDLGVTVVYKLETSMFPSILSEGVKIKENRESI